MYLLDPSVQLVNHIHILYCRRNLVALLVVHLSDDVTEVFAWTGLGETGNYVANLKTGNWANMLPYEFYTPFCYFFRAMSRKMLTFDGHKRDWNFSFNFIRNSNHNGLSNHLMLHQNLLHFSSRKTMSSSINDIILPRHYMKIPIFIEIPRISWVVVAMKSGKVFFYIDIVVVKDCSHKRWRKRLFHINCACLIGLAFDTCCRVDNFYVVAGKGLAGRSRFLWKSWKSKIIGKYRPSTFCLPIAIIDQLTLKMVLNPFKCGNITPFSH